MQEKGNFKLDEGSNLYVPNSYKAEPLYVPAPYELKPANQEMVGQREVFGADGHGSIRAESVESKKFDAETEADILEKDKLNEVILDPSAVLELRQDAERAKRWLKGDSEYSKAEKEADLEKEFIDGYLSEKFGAYPAGKYDNFSKAEKEEINNDPNRKFADAMRKSVTKLMEMPIDELTKKVETRTEKETLELTDDSPESPPTEGPENTDIRSKEIIPSNELQKLNIQLVAARSVFAQATAERKGKGHSFKYSAKKVAALETRYKSLLTDAGKMAGEEMKAAELSSEQILAASRFGVAVEQNELMKRIYHERIVKAEKSPLKKFYQFWAKRGKASKIGMMVVAGIPISAAAAFTVGALGGGVAGAGLFALAARGISKGLVGSKLNQKAEGYKTGDIKETIGIETQATEAKTADLLDSKFYDKDETTGIKTLKGYSPTAEDVTSIVREETEESVKRNKKRTYTAIGFGALFGAAGGLLTLDHPFGSGSGNPVTHSLAPKPVGAATPNLEGLSQLNIVGNPSQYDSYQYPWNYFADKFGADQATPKILELAQKAQAAGWTVNGTPNGIANIISTNGTSYSGTPEVIAALEAFDH